MIDWTKEIEQLRMAVPTDIAPLRFRGVHQPLRQLVASRITVEVRHVGPPTLCGCGRPMWDFMAVQDFGRRCTCRCASWAWSHEDMHVGPQIVLALPHHPRCFMVGPRQQEDPC